MNLPRKRRLVAFNEQLKIFNRGLGAVSCAPPGRKIQFSGSGNYNIHGRPLLCEPSLYPRGYPESRARHVGMDLRRMAALREPTLEFQVLFCENLTVSSLTATHQKEWFAAASKLRCFEISLPHAGAALLCASMRLRYRSQPRRGGWN